MLQIKENTKNSCSSYPESLDIDNLWTGDVPPKPKGKECPVGKISIVMSHCNYNLNWFSDFTKGFPINDIQIISKCGVTPQGAPSTNATILEMPNVGRCDHTFAYALQHMNLTNKDESDIVVFIKDNLIVHQRASHSRTFSEMIRIASQAGFACYQRSARLLSFYHQTNILTNLSMSSYQGARNENSNHEFSSNYRNMKHWLDDLNLSLPLPVTPLCYGGIFAVRVSQIAAVSNDVWRVMADNLSRGNNIEEGHFAERTWAGLLAPPLTPDQIKQLLIHTGRVNERPAKDGGGKLGALRRRHREDSDDDDDDDDDDSNSSDDDDDDDSDDDET